MEKGRKWDEMEKRCRKRKRMRNNKKRSKKYQDGVLRWNSQVCVSPKISFIINGSCELASFLDSKSIKKALK